MAEKQEAKAGEQPAVKLAKVRVLRPFLNSRTRLIEGRIGSIVEVPEADLPELTKDFGGQMAFRGERFVSDGDVKRHECRRAELVRETA